MTQPSSRTIELARELRESLAGTSLPRTFGKLYSQHTRLSANQPSLSSWQESEAIECLHDAVRLLDAAFVEREAGNESWADSVRRTSELLEWLSHPEININDLPLLLLSAASYQLAGYPARSLGLLNIETTDDNESNILRFLLKADFPTLLKYLTLYWAENISSLLDLDTFIAWDKAETLSDELQQRIVRETASALGILCAEMRWGNEPRLSKALQKITDVGKFLIHDYDPYSWLLAKLCAEVASVYSHSSMRHHIKKLSEDLNTEGQEALERYLRQSYQNRKTLAWPSQVRGIEKLVSGGSFALCTPTGSGKTTVAEIAMLQSLFLESKPESPSASAPLALYLVPTRALATEVESKLAEVLVTLNEPPIIVTGLYGGTDWGPTDAWLTADEPTILICTYEKAEALIRFLSPLFLHRVSLIVVDEAHMIQFEGRDRTHLRTAESRELRLEALSSRLFTYIDQSKGKVIALSAVASRIENTLAQWATGQPDATPAKTSYRSTRQLVGRLECLPNRRFRIYYDLLDGSNLQLQFANDYQDGIPYIPNPFPAYPFPQEWSRKHTNSGPEKRLRPYLFWAAMQLASPDNKGKQSSVLISVTQLISGYAEDFLTLLKTDWATETLPFFQQPTDPAKLEKWENCLAACEDYFGKASREYQLLQRGIVVHHGRMPGLMARFLVEVIQEQIVHLVLATSTLSEGVNLPFETILIPSLLRRGEELNAQEFGNLIGRAGRPGFGTEGRSLVLVESEPSWEVVNEEARKIRQARQRYFNLINALSRNDNNDGRQAHSPLAELIRYLEEQWQLISRTKNHSEFLQWLERTSPLQVGNDLAEDDYLYAIEALDALDSVLLSGLVEAEQANSNKLSAEEVEHQLRQIWQRTYAHYAAQEEAILEEIFIQRGSSLKRSIYPNAVQRRRLYRTSIPPRSGNKLLESYSKIVEHINSGEDYGIWSRNKDKKRCFAYVSRAIDLFKSLPYFGIRESLGKGKNAVSWDVILQWWLTSELPSKAPTDISQWHKFVSENFIYRFNWGLGSVIALAIDDIYDGEIFEPSLENWEQTGLPWIALWLKELIIWGTLEPVAAYLLSKGMAVTRSQAEMLAALYYKEQPDDQAGNKLLDATIIRDWATARLQQHEPRSYTNLPDQLKVRLLRDFNSAKNQNWRVVPVEVDKDIYWLDPAGFPLAICQKPIGWSTHFLEEYDFTLDSSEAVILSSSYL